ncbi:MAG: hypothetical protein QXG93_06800 [Nitrososphaerota archaeon]
MDEPSTCLTVFCFDAEDAVKFYEALMNHIVKNNSRLLKILGLE